MTVLDRAYSLLEIKGIDEEQRIIRGVATTPATDRMGDVVEPKGAVFKLPIPLLWQHDPDDPIGQVIEAKVTKGGIEIVAAIARGVSEEIDRAWALIKAGLVRGLSIGFRGLDAEQIPNSYGVRFNKWEWLELSCVTIAANSEASITSIKSLDRQLRAASGQKQHVVARLSTPSEAGTTTPKRVPKEGKEMTTTVRKTTGDMIADFEATRETKRARMEDLMLDAANKGLTLDAEQSQEYDDLAGEVKAIDDHLKRLRDMEAFKAREARPVPTEIRTIEEGSAARGLAPVQVKKHFEKGTGFVRLVASKWLGQQRGVPAADIAKQMFGDMPEVELVLRAGLDATNIADMMVQRAAVTPMSTTDGSSGGNYLVVAQNLASEFFELLRASTVIGQIPGLRRVPFNISVPRQLTDPTGYWVGQGDQKPVSRFTLDQVSLPFHKAAGIVPMTEELMRFSNPAAEGIVRTSLIGALTYLVDRDFLDPTKAETTGVSPASITYGVTPITATGTTADAFRADFGNMIANYLALNMSVRGIVVAMTSQQALRLSLMRNTLGQKEFPDIGINGGTIEGIPVITSENIVATGSSPTDGYPIIAINAPEVMIADDGGVSLDVSREASLQMNDAPDSPETASTVLVSLWQRNMVAFKAERFITWKKGRTGAVQFIQYAKYSE